MIYEWRNGAETLLLSAENYEKYHGMDSDFIILDEPNLYKEGGKLIEQLAIRCRGSIILTLNPSRKLDWLKAIQDRSDCKYIHSTYKDNPYLEKRVIDEIETRSKTDERFRRIYVQGLYVANLEEAVFTNWNISDFWPPADKIKRKIYGLDFGFANDPTALVELSYYNSRLYIREIFGEAKLTTIEIALELDKLPGEAVVIADNSEPRLLHELRTMIRPDIQIQKTIKKKGSILTGIRNLQDLELVLHSNSPYLIEEFELYSWKKINGELTDTPEDRNNHRIDGIRYANDYAKQYGY